VEIGCGHSTVSGKKVVARAHPQIRRFLSALWAVDIGANV
jgi:hypothetical protein